MAPSIKEGDCSDAWKSVVRKCKNGSSQIQIIYFDKYYDPLTYDNSFSINIYIVAVHRLSARIFYISNNLQNANVPIHEIVFPIPTPYYLDCLDKYTPMFLSIVIKFHFFPDV